MQTDEERLLAIRNQAEDWLNQQPGITGTGIGLGRSGQVCIKVFTNRMPPETKEAIAQRLQGVPVDFEETGEFVAF